MTVGPRALGRRTEHRVKMVGETNRRVEVAAVAPLRERHVPHRRLDEVTLPVEFVPAVVDVMRIAASDIPIRLLAGNVVLQEPLQDVDEVLPLGVAFEREHRRLREVSFKCAAMHAETLPAVRNPHPFQTVEPVGPETRDLERGLRHEPHLRRRCGVRTADCRRGGDHSTDADHSAARKTFAARMVFSRAASAAALFLPTQ